MKKIISAILAIMMIFSLSLCLFACDNGTDEGGENGGNQTPTNKTYTVTVVDEDGKGVKNAYISFFAEGGMALPYPTGSDGKASFSSEKKVTITLLSIPDGYECDSVGAELTPDANGNVTVTLRKAAAADPYVILVVDDKGNPVKGVTVQMCDAVTDSCRSPQVTGEDGKVEYAFEEGEFKVQLTGGMNGVPEGYTIDDPKQNFYFEGKLCTITLTKID